MRKLFFCLVDLLLIFSFFIPTTSVAQCSEDPWRIGMSLSPLFELQSTGLNGGLINLHIERRMSKRLMLGMQPYFAIADEKELYAYDLISREPRAVRKDVFYSFGLNGEIKTLLADLPRITPYSSIVFGAGLSKYELFVNNVYGEMEPHFTSNFINCNLGLGFGAYLKITKKISLDAKVMYTYVTANKKIEDSSYLYPAIGLLLTP